MVRRIANDADTSRWIYSTRNSVVHETRDTFIPLDDDTKWNIAITCLIVLIIELQHFKH